MTKPIYGGILCAGFGTRMRPITEVVPKPLIPFLNTPIVAYSLTQLKAAGAERVVANLHHLADTIPDVMDRLGGAFGMPIIYSREWEILGTAGGIRGMWQALGEPEGTLVVLNGDSVMDIDIASHVAAHRESGNDVTLVVRPRAPLQPGRVFVDAAGHICRIRDYERPGVEAVAEMDFLGVHILESHAIARLPVEEGDIVDSLYGPLVTENAAIGVSRSDLFWAAIDNPRLLLETTRHVLENPDLFSLAPFPEPLREGLWAYSPSGIHGQAQLAAPVFCGMNVTIGAGARIGPNVVMDGVDVAPGAVIENAVLYGMGTIEGEWRDCVAVAGKVAQSD